ncbi:MAG: hypothetical protein AMJ43_11005 [Coxiella sp. DG_40]|nr:MAG: hypothetical protein AMJ43_11005 [Coxiella sp. DG_40]
MAECKHKKLILISATIDELIPDQEPHKAGEFEKLDAIFHLVELMGHYCPKCEKLVDIEIESQN